MKDDFVTKRHLKVKRFADGLRKEAGVDLDRLNRLMGESLRTDGAAGMAMPYQTLTNTNSWRASGDERGAPGKHTVFATDRFDLQ